MDETFTERRHADRTIIITIDGYQLRYALWLGEGDLQRGIRRCINFADDHTFNHPTPPGLDVPDELFDPEKDYEGYYAVNPPKPDDD